MRYLFGSIVILALASPAGAQFIGDRDACWVYATTLNSVSMMTREEARDRLKRVYEIARADGISNPKVWEASRAMLTAATSGRGVNEALDGMAEACRDRGSFIFRDWRSKPTAPTTQDEATKQLRGVLEREGATDAKCHQKQYGSGWVTICE
jgi:hypothetical protein